MTSIEYTAYPRLKRTLTAKELDQIYTPTPAEIFLAHCSAKGPVAALGFHIHLKVFQRLGYAVATSEILASIIDYIARCATILLSPRDLAGYDDSGTRQRHLPLIRHASGTLSRTSSQQPGSCRELCCYFFSMFEGVVVLLRRVSHLTLDLRQAQEYWRAILCLTHREGVPFVVLLW